MTFDYTLFSTFNENFLSELSAQRNLSGKTICAYRYDLNQLFTWLSQKHLCDFNQSNINLYFEYLQKEKHLCSSSIQRKYISIHQFCDYLLHFQYANETFFRFTTRRFQLPRLLPRTLSNTEIQKLILATEKAYYQTSSAFHKQICIRDMCIIEMLFCLGLRISEISLLELNDIDFATNCVLIHGKRSRERMLYIPSKTVLDKLQHWLNIRSSLSPQTSHVFINKYGKQLSIYGIENIFSKYRNLAGINPKSTPHYLRHSFATQLLNNGATIRDVQELLGHSSVATTQIYTEVTIERKIEVMSKFNQRNYLFS